MEILQNCENIYYMHVYYMHVYVHMYVQKYAYAESRSLEVLHFNVYTTSNKRLDLHNTRLNRIN